MFDFLQNKLSDAFRSLRGKAKFSEANMREGLDLVQNALLEADVSYPVVQKFIADISAEALGERVIKSLDPTQLVANIVYQKLVELMMGDTPAREDRGGALGVLDIERRSHELLVQSFHLFDDNQMVIKTQAIIEVVKNS